MPFLENIGKLKHSLAYKFAGAVFLFSLVAGLIVAMLTLYITYIHDNRDLNIMLERIHLSVEQTLITGLWLTNDDVVTATLEGIINVPAIEQVTIHRNDGTTLTHGTITSARTLLHNHPLSYEYRGQAIPLGTLTITAGDDLPIYSALVNVVTMAGPILILAMLGAAISFLLFYFFIGQHLQEVASYSAGIDLDSLDKPLELKRPPHDGERDELDLIISALNNMRTSLFTSLARTREHDAKYKALVSNSSDAIVSIDGKNRIIYANPATCDYLNLPLEDVLGKTHSEVGFAEDVSQSIEREVQDVLAEGVTREISIDLQSTTQGLLSFELQLTPNESQNGEVVSVVGIARDITARKRSESILRATFQHLPMIMGISDIGTGRFVEVNDRFCEITGYTREQAIGTTSIELGFSDRETRNKILRVILKEGFVEDMELQLVRADGRPMSCMYSGEIIELHGSSVLLSFAHDITEQKKALLERASLERQLQQAMKMEAIGTLAGGIAHDFNNILSAILGYGQLALEQTATESPVYSDLCQVIQAGTRASDLVQQILAFSRQGQEEFRPVRLQPLIKEVAKLLRSTMPATINLRLDVDEKSGTILADTVQLHQVLMNLCTNARQAIGNRNGTIDITLKEVTITQPLYSVDNNPLKYGSYLELKVSDSGAGIPPEILARIFDPFFTTREKDHGTGLGLAVTHGIIAKHKGAITVDSIPGKGTCFCIYLPIIDSPMLTDTTSPADNLYGEEHILLVDDESMLVEILERALRRLGYEVSSFTNSQEALNFFMSYPNTIDLLVTDMTMPGMTGLVMFKEMRKIRPELQVILCTGYSDAIDEDTAKHEGINAFLRKPVIGKDIAQAIRAVSNM